MSDRQEHWQSVYERKAPQEQSWYQPEPTISLELIEAVAEAEPVRLVDVGGGASTLVDHLLERGGFDVTVVDIAPDALDSSKERLEERADDVEWMIADVTGPLDVDGPVDIWHDRAVFHFLIDDAELDAYRANVDEHLAEGGHIVISTFAPDGPETCSGLPVQRYSPERLATTFGDDYRLVDSRREVHSTPWGGKQPFVYALLERVS